MTQIVGTDIPEDMSFEDALAHYGVKGMRWGYRKAEPNSTSVPSSGQAEKTLDAKPSRSEARTARRNEKADLLTARASKMEVRVSEIQSELKALPRNRESYRTRVQLQGELNQNIGESRSLKATAEAIRKGKMTPTQKKILIGAGAAALIVGGVYGAQGARMAQSGQLNAYKLRGQSLLKGNRTFEFKKNPKLSEYNDPADVLKHVVKPVNPNYRIPGGQMNCRRSTYTYELRRRGYDVQATTSSLGWGQSETGAINALTKGRNISRSTSLSSNVAGGLGIRRKVVGDKRINPAQGMRIADANDRMSVFKALASQPTGARGEIVFDFRGFGHSLAYENFNGKPFIFDSQKGVGYDMSKPDEYLAFIEKWSGAGGVRGAEITRLDNMDLDQSFLARWATNRK